MGKSSYLTVRIDPSVKNEARELFDSLGISMTDAVTIFLHQALINGGLPFKVENRAQRQETNFKHV